jgi:hypothetical protein
MKLRRVKRQLIVLAPLVIVLVIWLLISFANKFLRDLYYEYRYIECKPEELLPDLERIFDVNFPEGIREVRTAKTRGLWDSTDSAFIVKFSAPPDITNKFVESFPEKVTLGSYEAESDFRNNRQLSTPQWFIESIKKGNEGSVYASNKDIDLYIDTSNKKNFVVYLRGYYEPKELKR